MISAIIPTYKRTDQLLNSLQELLNCTPPPDEICVYVDGDDIYTAHAVNRKYPTVKVLCSNTRLGPGGGRNLLIQAARHSLVASFDDDSYPLDKDFFHRIPDLFLHYPQAAVITGSIYCRDQEITLSTYSPKPVMSFEAGGCVFRRDAFLETSGFIALPLAYGIEETDLSLRLRASSWEIIHTPVLRIFHDTTLDHHSKPQIVAASIANLALLAYLRYPPEYLVYGFGQCANRIKWLLTHRRYRGIIAGILGIFPLIWKYRHERLPVSRHFFIHHLRQRRLLTRAIKE